jgi:uncharacterized C2H2 Zn-finger protein
VRELENGVALGHLLEE